MTLPDQHVPVTAWNEPDGLIPRGTLIVIPGRGELPEVNERFGRRLAGDALVSITAGRHDVLNDQAHRTVAATVVLFLERIRQDAGWYPIAVWEQLDDDKRARRRVRAVPYRGDMPRVLTETRPRPG